MYTYKCAHINTKRTDTQNTPKPDQGTYLDDVNDVAQVPGRLLELELREGGAHLVHRLHARRLRWWWWLYVWMWACTCETEGKGSCHGHDLPATPPHGAGEARGKGW